MNFEVLDNVESPGRQAGEHLLEGINDVVSEMEPSSMTIVGLYFEQR